MLTSISNSRCYSYTLSVHRSRTRRIILSSVLQTYLSKERSLSKILPTKSHICCWNEAKYNHCSHSFGSYTYAGQRRAREVKAGRSNELTIKLLSQFDDQSLRSVGKVNNRLDPVSVEEFLNAIAYWCAQSKESAHTITKGTSQKSKAAFESVATAEKLLRLLIDTSFQQLKDGVSFPWIKTNSFCLIPLEVVQLVLNTYRICVERSLIALQHNDESNYRQKNVDGARKEVQFHASQLRRLFQYLTEGRIQTEHSSMRIIPFVNVICCNIVMDALAKSGDAHGAQELLDQMERKGWDDISKKSNAIVAAPDIISYNTCIKGWTSLVKELGTYLSSCKDPKQKEAVASQAWEAALQAEKILNHLKCNSRRKAREVNDKMHKDFFPSAPLPDTITYTAVIDAFTQCPPSPGMESVHKAQKLLDEMLNDHISSRKSTIKPNSVTLGAVLHGLAQHSHFIPDAAQRADNLLQRMENLFEETRDYDFYPTTTCYNIVIDAWARSMQGDAAEKAERLLVKMSNVDQSLRPPHIDRQEYSKHHEPYSIHQDIPAHPTLYSYNSVLNAYAKSRRTDAGSRAESLLAAMEKDFESGNLDASPDTFSFTAVIDALSKSYQRDSATKARALLERMIRLWLAGNEKVRPNRFTFTAVIDAYAKSQHKEAVVEVESLLHRMLQLAKKYGHQDMQPNTLTYNAILNCLARRGEAEKAQKLLEDMLARRKDELSEVDTTSFNSCINAWANAKIPVAVQKVTQLLETMNIIQNESNNNQVRPDTVTYNSALNAIANSGLPDCSSAAERIFSEMEQRGIKKDTSTFNSLLKAYVKSNSSDSPIRAEKLLHQMHDDYLVGSGPAPDITSCNTVLNAWARSRTRRDKAEGAFELLCKMDSSLFGSVRPDTISYNTALNACATSINSVSKQNPLNLLLQLMTMLEESSTAREDEVSFQIAFKGIHRLCSEQRERERLSKELFSRCISKGLFTQSAKQKLQLCAPGVHDQMLNQLRGGVVPREWTNNVSRRRRPR